MRRKGEARGSTWNSLKRLGPVRRCAVILRGGMRCAWCDVDVTRETVEIDHVVPRARGGSDKPDNVVPACHDCNDARGGAMPGSIPEHVAAQLAKPLDIDAGRALAVTWYPWFPAMMEKNKIAQRARDAAKRARNRAARAEGLDGTAFPFGEQVMGS